ncbi:MAG: ribonuclease R [Fimbriiglobus sp.]|jgi:ribonuclease R|nr:ribonuclease R [Fimbriiglobus sp.]
MSDLTTRILEALGRPSYSPLKPKVLAKRMNVGDDEYPEFRRTLRQLVHEGRVEVGRNNTLRLADKHGSIVGTYRRTNSGTGFVRPDVRPGEQPHSDILIREGREMDAATGDRVMVKVTRKNTKSENARGEVVRILERSTRTFVGTYFERDGEAFVRVDGTVFAHSVLVGDAGTKGVRPQDKVQIDLLKFPTADSRGEGVITEVFGPLSKKGVDVLTVIRAFGIPDEFPEAVLAEARAQADQFNEADLQGRTDFTGETVVTIDPVDAKDFDDAVSVTVDPETNHWILTVHIADVAHFCKPGGALDTEARKRGTSVYLPQRVIPMFPEIISNGLASLQQGKVRYVKTARIEYTPDVKVANVEFFNGAIRVAQRFSYEQVQAILDEPELQRSRVQDVEAHAPPPFAGEVRPMLDRMKALALRLRAKRMQRGALELSMPEAVLEYDADGRVCGAHFASHDLSHQIIEEFMLAANVAVAEHLSRLGVPFLRRVHPAPNEDKLYEFSQFSALLGHPMKRHLDRFELQRLLAETADKPERAAIHYSLLRSLKQAAYSPIQDEHYALAFQDYCHFTSPIRRYPDLQVHRLIDRWVKAKKVSANEAELIALGDHCSKTERRAEQAERELVKLRILQHLSTRLGEQHDAVITGVAEYGFFAQAEKFPAEGLAHISSLTDDYYHYDEGSHSLTGGRTKKRYRLGDRVRVEVARVDLQKRMLDWRIVRDVTSGRREPSGVSPTPDAPRPMPKSRPRKSGPPADLPEPRKKRRK